MPKCILTEQGGKGNGGGGGPSNVTVDFIAITHGPNKSSYFYGETFDPTGIEVTASMLLSGIVPVEKALTASEWDYSPKGTLTHENTNIVITYNYDDSSASVNVPITIKKIPTGLTVASAPTKSTYEYNQNFDKTGMTATVQYSDGSTKTAAANELTVPTTTLTNLGTQNVSVTYVENGYTVQTTYGATVTKATPVITPSKTAFAITASALTDSMTITSNESGALTATVKSGGPGGITTQVDGRTVKVTGDGVQSHAGTTTIIISTAETDHYKPGSKEIECVATYWSWGTETEIGDAAWWAGLKSWAAGASVAERLACVGKKKKVTLSTAVRGWNNGANVSMICIGSDIDGTGTLTFQTEGCSPSQGAFSASNAKYSTSTAKTEAETFANNCSATASMKSVTKLTCTSEPNNTQTWAADGKTTAKGFITSDCEMGFIAGADSNSGKGYAMSYQEWTEGGAQKAYQYYTNNDRRKKFYCSANGDITTSTGWYWERSRYYDTANGVCFVGSGGTPNFNSYGNTGGRLAPAFVIG